MSYQRCINTHGENENYTFLGFLESDIIKQPYERKKKEMSTSEKLETFLKIISATEIISKEWIPWQIPL